MNTTWTIGHITLHFMEPVCKRTAVKHLSRRAPQLTSLWRNV